MKWKPGMTLSQRRKYNEYHRKRKLIRRLQQGHVPQPIKPASWLLDLYKQYGVDHLVSIPQAWMSDEVKKGIKEEQRKLYQEVRNSLPADATRSDVLEAMRLSKLK